MGRNGKKEPVFKATVTFISEHFGEIVSSKEILLGKEPGRNAETAYLYKFVKLGYVKPIGDSFVNNKNSKFKIVKQLPINYTSVLLKRDLRIINGFIE